MPTSRGPISLVASAISSLPAPRAPPPVGAQALARSGRAKTLNAMPALIRNGKVQLAARRCSRLFTTLLAHEPTAGSAGFRMRVGGRHDSARAEQLGTDTDHRIVCISIGKAETARILGSAPLGMDVRAGLSAATWWRVDRRGFGLFRTAVFVLSMAKEGSLAHETSPW